MKKIIFSLLTLIFTISFSFAQAPHRSCATMDHLAMQMQQDPGLAQRMAQIENFTANYLQSGGEQRTVITIPVVVHVVYNTSAQNISDALIQAQIAQLNADYSRTNSDAGNTPAVWQTVAANTNIHC